MLSLIPLPAAAEWYGGVYAGAAFTGELGTTSQADPHPREGRGRRSVIGGGRVGYWLGRVPGVGLALDASAFKPGRDITVVPISLLFLGRIPLWSLQPYVGLGPGLFVSHIDGSNVLGRTGVTARDTSVDLGLDVRTGLAWWIWNRVGLFGEFRFTWFEPRFKAERPTGTDEIQPEISTHHFLLGLQFRF